MSEFNDVDKALLIDSMSKLIANIAESKVHQMEIFSSLTSNDLNKILSNIEDKNPLLRKTSCRFLCELLYNNPAMQNMFCELTDILPLDGKVCVNKIPDSLQVQQFTVFEIIECIQNTPQATHPDNNNSPLCWYFQPSNGSLQNCKNGVQHIFPEDLKDKQPDDFIDPEYSLFGFFIFSDLKPIDSCLVSAPNKQKGNKRNYYNSLTQSHEFSKSSLEYDESYRLLHLQRQAHQSRVSPIKKRDQILAASLTLQNGTKSNSMIKKVQLTQTGPNDSHSRNDRSHSEKREINLNTHGKKDQNQTQEMSSIYKAVKSTGQQNGDSLHSASSSQHKVQTQPTESYPMANFLNETPSVQKAQSPRQELSSRTKGNNYQLFERRKTSEGILDKSLKFNNLSTSARAVKPKQISISSGIFTAGGSYSKRKDQKGQSISQSTTSASSHGIQVKKFHLGSLSPQNGMTNNNQQQIQQQNNFSSSSFDNNFIKQLEQKYESNKPGYSQQQNSMHHRSINLGDDPKKVAEKSFSDHQSTSSGLKVIKANSINHNNNSNNNNNNGNNNSINNQALQQLHHPQQTSEIIIPNSEGMSSVQTPKFIQNKPSGQQLNQSPTSHIEGFSQHNLQLHSQQLNTFNNSGANSSTSTSGKNQKKYVSFNSSKVSTSKSISFNK